MFAFFIVKTNYIIIEIMFVCDYACINTYELFNFSDSRWRQTELA